MHWIIVLASALVISIIIDRISLFRTVASIWLKYTIYDTDLFANIVHLVWNERIQNLILAELPKLYVILPIVVASIGLGVLLPIDLYKLK